MDPNDVLERIRLQLSAFYGYDPDVPEFDVDQLVDDVSALDEWVASGGFLPQEWQ